MIRTTRSFVAVACWRSGLLLSLPFAVTLAGCASEPPETPGVALASPLSVGQLTVNIQTSSGNYVDADQGGGGALMAASTWARSWETFTLSDLNGGALEDGDIVTLQGGQGQWVSAANGGGGAVTVSSAWARSWEQFQISKMAGSGTIGDGDTFALKTTVGGEYVSAANGGGGAVTATAPWARSWETLTLHVVPKAPRARSPRSPRTFRAGPGTNPRPTPTRASSTFETRQGCPP